MDEAGDVTIRVADPRADANLMSQVDTSFETDTVFEVHADDYGFRLATRLADEPIRKVFPLDDISGDHRWEHAWLAMDSATAVGFIAAQYESWNSRAVIWHFYVNPTHRKRGIGRRLLDACLAEARVEGMKTAWLEPSN